MLWVADSENQEEKAEAIFDSHEEVNDATKYSNTVERDKLLFSVFSLLHKLGADERPEVIGFFSSSKSSLSILLFTLKRSRTHLPQMNSTICPIDIFTLFFEFLP